MDVPRRYWAFLVLSLVSLGQCRSGRSEVASTRPPSVFSAAIDEALETLQSHTEVAATRVAESQRALEELNKGVQRRLAQLQDEPEDDSVDIEQMERLVYAHFDRASDWVGFMRSSVDFVEQTAAILQGTAALIQAEGHSLQDLVEALRASHQDIQQAAELLDETRLHLAEIRAKRDIEEHARQFRSLYATLNELLEGVHSGAVEFQAKIEDKRSDLQSDERRIQEQLLKVAILLTLILTWVGIAQLSLLVHGLKLLFSPTRHPRPI